MSEKYPAVGCTGRFFVDTQSFRAPRGSVCLFSGFKHDDGTPDRTMSAFLVAVADSVDELRLAHPEAFENERAGRCPVCGGLNPGDVTHARC